MRRIIGVYGSNEESRGCKGGKRCKTGSWGTFVHIDIFQGVYSLGEVFCLGLGFLFLSQLPPRKLCVVVFICGNFIQMLWFFLELTIVLNSDGNKRFGVDKLEMFASDFLFFYERKPATVLETTPPPPPIPWSLFLVHPKTQTMVNHHIT